jgi:hypothetical protein
VDIKKIYLTKLGWEGSNSHNSISKIDDLPN